MNALSLPKDNAANGSTLATLLSAQLREVILNGELLPGAKLNLGELKDTFGVSLSPLREALSRLSTEGLVELEDNKGYRTSRISEQNLIEITRLRALLEPIALAEAIRHGGEAWESGVVVAHYQLNKIDEAGDRAARLDEWERHHHGFHDALIAGCPMVLLLQFCGTLNRLKDRYRRLFRDLVTTSKTTRDIRGEHRQMLEAALARDEATATRLLQAHIQMTGDHLLQSMRRQADKPVKGRMGTKPAAKKAGKSPKSPHAK